MKKRRSEDKKQNGTKVWSETQGMSPAVCIHCVEFCSLSVQPVNVTRT